jgi:hypothetical protein
MTNTSNRSTTPAWSVWPWPPFFFDLPGRIESVGFEQPINPGWTFGNLISVTEQNSSAPDTERQIVATESYGRQLGWVIDALAELIVEQPEAIQQKPAIKELISLRKKIERIKLHSAAYRLDRLRKT